MTGKAKIKKSGAQLAQAYIDGQKAIDAFERREASAQLRCFAVVRELERRRAGRANRDESFELPASEVIDAEFRDAAE